MSTSPSTSTPKTDTNTTINKPDKDKSTTTTNKVKALEEKVKKRLHQADVLEKRSIQHDNTAARATDVIDRRFHTAQGKFQDHMSGAAYADAAVLERRADVKREEEGKR